MRWITYVWESLCTWTASILEYRRASQADILGNVLVTLILDHTLGRAQARLGQVPAEARATTRAPVDWVGDFCVSCRTCSADGVATPSGENDTSEPRDINMISRSRVWQWKRSHQVWISIQSGHGQGEGGNTLDIQESMGNDTQRAEPQTGDVEWRMPPQCPMATQAKGPSQTSSRQSQQEWCRHL